jgi:hypothetical protein
VGAVSDAVVIGSRLIQLSKPRPRENAPRRGAERLHGRDPRRWTPIDA